MLVYEITGYQGCHREAFDGPNQQEEPNWLSKSQHEQIIGQPWDFQERFDTTIFFPNQGASSEDTAAAVGVCDM